MATHTLKSGEKPNDKQSLWQPGDTVQVEPAQFDVTSLITVAAGVRFVGERGKSRFRTTNDRQFGFRLGDGRVLSFTDIAFDGGAVDCQGTSTLNMDWCEFTNFNRAPSGAYGGGLAVGSGGHGAGWKAKGKVSNCLFYDGSGPNKRGGGWALGWFTCDGFAVVNNHFINIHNALKSDNGSDTGHTYARNLDVLGNYFAKIARMGAEFQGGCEGFNFADNFYELPYMLPGSWEQNDDVFAFSIIYNGQKNRNCLVERNVVHGLPLINANTGGQSNSRIDGQGVRIAFEVGNNFIVRDNLTDGCHSAVQAYMDETTVNPPSPIFDSLIGPTICENNRFWDNNDGRDNGNTIYGHGDHEDRFTARNNTEATALTWDPNRGRPKRGGGFESGAPSPTPTPTPTPTPSPTMNITSKVNSPTTATVNISGVPTGATALRVEFISTSGRESCGTVVLPQAKDGAYNFENFPQNWKVDATAIATVGGTDQRSNPLTIILGTGPGAAGPTTVRLASATTPAPTPTPTPTPGTKRKVKSVVMEFDDGDIQRMP